MPLQSVSSFFHEDSGVPLNQGLQSVWHHDTVRLGADNPTMLARGALLLQSQLVKRLRLWSVLTSGRAALEVRGEMHRQGSISASTAISSHLSSASTAPVTRSLLGGLLCSLMAQLLSQSLQCVLRFLPPRCLLLQLAVDLGYLGHERVDQTLFVLLTKRHTVSSLLR